MLQFREIVELALHCSNFELEDKVAQRKMYKPNFQYSFYLGYNYCNRDET